MRKRHGQRGSDAAPAAQPDQGADRSPGWRRWLLGEAAGWAVSPVLRMISALLVGMAVVVIGVGWTIGVQPLVDVVHYRGFTATAQGRIVDGWLALEVDPRIVAQASRWIGAARTTPCAIVAYDGEWGAPIERAFCGNRLRVHSSDVLAPMVDAPEMSPGVPFAMPRDARGFTRPQLRLAPALLDALRRQPSADDPARSELAVLQALLDRPIADAVEGWSRPLPAFPVLFDPAEPASAMPLGFVQTRREHADPGVALVACGILAAGVLLWFRAMALMLSGLPAGARRFAAIVPLLALPWWGDHMPRAIARLDPRVAEVVGEMLGDIDPTGRLVATPAADAVGARGERLAWPIGEGLYAQTLGAIAFSAPDRPLDPDAALRELIRQAGTQVGAWEPARRAALFGRLADDQRARRVGAGLAFVPAALAELDAATPDADAAATARAFLDAWVTQPIDEPDPAQPAYRARVDVWRALAASATGDIAVRAGWVVARQPPP